MSGFAAYLLIDLSTGAAERREIPEAVMRSRIGGAGLGVHLARELTPAGVDPLGPEAPIVFVFSPLVGTPLTTSAKFAVVAKSPLTGLLNDALSSSHFAIAGRMTGHEAIVLTGRAPQPSVCVIDQQGVRVDPAPELWGLPAADAEEALRARLGRGYRAAAIGPAGERAGPLRDGLSHDGRHAGRGGQGAVLGSKKIKALAVRGDAPCPSADPTGVPVAGGDLSAALVRAGDREVPRAGDGRQPARLQPLRRAADPQLPAGASRRRRAAGRRGPRLRPSVARAVVRSLHDRLRAHLRRPATAGVRLEYESLFALGPLCGVDDPEAVLRAAPRCDELGIDTISAGARSRL